MEVVKIRMVHIDLNFLTVRLQRDLEDGLELSETVIMQEQSTVALIVIMLQELQQVTVVPYPVRYHRQFLMKLKTVTM